MILLLNDYDQLSKDFHRSLLASSLDYPTFVCNDGGFLPENVHNMYEYWLEDKPQATPKYFNQIDIPPFWEIRGTNQVGEIYDMHIKRGEIHYAPQTQDRYVQSVDWFDEQGIKRITDGYNKQGRCYKKTVFTTDQRAVTTSYFNSHGKEVIVYNHHTNDYILNEAQGIRIFHSDYEFMLYTLEQMDVSLESIIYNTLATPFMITYHSGQNKQAALIWQEDIDDDIPGNMKIILNGDTTTRQIVVPDQAVAQKLAQKAEDQGLTGCPINELGYVYPFKENKQDSRQALVLTNSDQIMGLEQIAQALPQTTIHVVALTEMSANLTSLAKYANIQLYPNANLQIIRQLMSEVAWLLDINCGNEIVQAVRSAFDYQITTLAFKETAHNPAFTTPELIYEADQVTEMINVIKAGQASDAYMNLLLSMQKQIAHTVQKEDYIHLFTPMEV